MQDRRDNIKSKYRGRSITLAFFVLIVIVAFVLIMRSSLNRIAIADQTDDNECFFATTTATLDSNSLEARTLENDFHNSHEIILRDLQKAFASGGLSGMEEMDIRKQADILGSATYTMSNCAWLIITDNAGNVICSNNYNNVGINLLKDGVLEEKEYNSLISEERAHITMDNVLIDESTGESYSLYEGFGNTLYIYSERINQNDRGNDNKFLVIAFGSSVLDKTRSEVYRYNNWLDGSSVGNAGLVFLVDSESKKIKYGEVSDDAQKYFLKNPLPQRNEEGNDELSMTEGTSVNDGFDEPEQISSEMLTGYDIDVTGICGDILSDGYSGTQYIYGVPHFISCKRYSSEVYGDNYIVAAIPLDELYNGNLSVIIWSVCLLLIVVALTLTYAAFIRGDILKQGRDLKKVKLFKGSKGNKYFSRTIAVRILPITLVGILIVFVASFYMLTLLKLSDAFAESVSVQKNVSNRIESSNTTKDFYNTYYSEQNLTRAKLLSFLVSANGDKYLNVDRLDNNVHIHSRFNSKGTREPLRDSYGNPLYAVAGSENLNILCFENEMELIDIFDENGCVIASNGYDWGFNLSTDPNSQSYPFWEVIDGRREYYVQDPMEDDHGDYSQYVGCDFSYYTRLDDDGNTVYENYLNYIKQYDKGYNGPEITRHNGMFQLAIRPENVGRMIESVKPEYILANTQINGEGFLIGFDNSETDNGIHRVIYSPRTRSIGKSAEEIGVMENAFSGTYNGFQMLNGREYLQCYRQAGDYFVATAIPVKSLYVESRDISLVFALLTAVVLIVMSGFAVLVEDMDAAEVSREENDPLAIFGHLNKKGSAAPVTPGERFGQVFKKCLVAMGILLLVSVLYGEKSFGNESAIAYIFGKEWERGIHIFSISTCMVIVISVAIGITILDKLVTSITASLNNRVRTVRHLILTFIKYTAAIVTLFYCLYLLGFNAGSLLASAGILTAVIGIGAQSLISDLLAGIFIVMEGVIHVGDFLVVDDFRGIVIEMGIRTTTLEDDNQNIKTVNNSHLTSIINLSKKNTVIFLPVPIPYEESVDRIKEVLDRELPGMRGTIDGLVGTPKYVGIEEFADSSINLTIKFTCVESKRLQVQRSVKVAIWHIFKNNDIEIPFTQIDIHTK